MADEGSVFVEGIDSDYDESSETEENSSEQINNNEETTEAPVESTTKTTEVEEEKSQLTDKGTKLDPNPQSAAYQLLANERKQREQYEAILNNPTALKQYLKQIEPEQAVEQEFTPDKLKTAEDVVNALNSIKSDFTKKSQTYEQTIKELQEKVYGLSEGREVEQIAHTVETDISRVREKYPELNPKSPQYNPDIEKSVSNLYHRFDFDPKLNRYRGKVSISEIADSVMSAASKAKQAGSQEAQTVIKDKSFARVVTSSKKGGESETQSSDPATAIAAKINKAFK